MPIRDKRKFKIIANNFFQYLRDNYDFKYVFENDELQNIKENASLFVNENDYKKILLEYFYDNDEIKYKKYKQSYLNKEFLKPGEKNVEPDDYFSSETSKEIYKKVYTNFLIEYENENDPERVIYETAIEKRKKEFLEKIK
mmetsp:Transcript_17768/g.49174  ORF Transcript_17768/g.49174 Transcript_17768/m.49174 type:complete len:141 (+) Transcript_17768:298-720(+)